MASLFDLPLEAGEVAAAAEEEPLHRWPTNQALKMLATRLVRRQIVDQEAGEEEGEVAAELEQPEVPYRQWLSRHSSPRHFGELDDCESHRGTMLLVSHLWEAEAVVAVA